MNVKESYLLLYLVAHRTLLFSAVWFTLIRVTHFMLFRSLFELWRHKKTGVMPRRQKQQQWHAAHDAVLWR